MTIVEQSYPTRSYYPRLTLLAIGLFVVGTNAFVIAGLLPSIAASLGASVSDVSYSISWYALVVAIAAPAISIVLPRLSRTTLMSTGLLVIAGGTVMAAAAPNLEWFIVGRVLAAFGGAALVPAATAAAAAIAPVARRGSAIAFVALGFTAATALGSPIGTAIGAVGGWRLPLFTVAGIALVIGTLIAILVRDIPLAPPTRLGQRFSVLSEHRVMLPLLATVLVTIGFNTVYIFSSEIVHAATAGSGSLLAILLLVYGVAGTVGNLAAGTLTDRWGGRRIATVFLVVQAAALLALPLISGNLIASAVDFAVWGIAAFASAPPIQHRLVAVDPARSALTLSWYTTAMYVGIALAPPVGAEAIRLGGAQLVPVVASVAVLLSMIVFSLGYVHRSSRATTRVGAEAGS